MKWRNGKVLLILFLPLENSIFLAWTYFLLHNVDVTWEWYGLKVSSGCYLINVNLLRKEKTFSEEKFDLGCKVLEEEEVLRKIFG